MWGRQGKELNNKKKVNYGETKWSSKQNHRNDKHQPNNNDEKDYGIKTTHTIVSMFMKCKRIWSMLYDLLKSWNSRIWLVTHRIDTRWFSALDVFCSSSSLQRSTYNKTFSEYFRQKHRRAVPDQLQVDQETHALSRTTLWTTSIWPNTSWETKGFWTLGIVCAMNRGDIVDG